MERRQTMSLPRVALAGWIALFLATASLPAWAQVPMEGSRNFQPPSSAPNYFSNEAGPFRGGAGAETTYSSSPPIQQPMVVSPSPPARVAAAPSRSTQRHVARAKGRAKLAQARARGQRHTERPRLAKAKSASRIALARGKAKTPIKIAMVRKRTATKSLAAKHQPAATKGRPSKDKRTHTASR
jgi:hypothetical protein